MNKSKIVEIRAKLEVAMKILFEKEGITGSVGRGVYDSKTCTFKVSFVESSAENAYGSIEAEDFLQFATAYGLTAGCLGKVITVNGRSLEIAGLRRSARKNNILLICQSSGERRVAPHTLVLERLNLI